jgi:hypothetical protein
VVRTKGKLNDETTCESTVMGTIINYNIINNYYNMWYIEMYKRIVGDGVVGVDHRCDANDIFFLT